MSCVFLRALLPEATRFDCAGSPAAPYALGLLALVVLASAALAWRARRAGVKGPSVWLVPLLFSLSAVMLLGAIQRPILRDGPVAASQGGHVVVLVDRSESFWRDPQAPADLLATAATRLEQFSATLPAGDLPSWQGNLVGFGAGASPEGAVMPLANLPAAVRRYRASRPEPASDLSAGLKAALAGLAEAPGRRLLMVLSDGWSAPEPDEQLLAEIRSAGIEVYLGWAGSTAPASGLIAADLAPEHWLGAAALVRGTVLGEGRLELTDASGAMVQLDVPDAAELRAVRLETAFRQRGLQSVELRFGADEAVQQRRLFTLVRGPARLLVFGEAPWAGALPPERWQVQRAGPASPPDPAPFDLVVIDALAPSAFPPDYPARLLAGAARTGIFLVNGPQRGAATEPQVISDWGETVLKPILPVDSDPRLFVQQPPPRDIVIMVDVSGSMAWGSRLSSARSVIKAILDQLRPSDTVAILPFADGSRGEFPRAPATAANLEGARRFTDRLQASGGTAPEHTIRDSARLASNYCAFFFVSDADFAPPQTSPRCFTTAISVSDSRYQMDISRWGEEIMLGEGGDGRNIQLSYFKPEEREEYFRPGRFLPVTAGTEAGLPAQISVDGLAISYARVDAQIQLIHEAPPPDPLFVTRRESGLSGIVTGVFLGEMTADWGSQAPSATEEMLSQLLGWSDQDRYLVRLLERSGRLIFSVTELSTEPAAGMLSASLIAEDGSARGIPLVFNPRSGAHFAEIEASTFSAGRGVLIIQQGENVQYIPLRIDPKRGDHSRGQEAFDYGINLRIFEELLAKFNASGLIETSVGIVAPVPQPEAVPLHKFWILISFLFLTAAVWSRELRHK